MLETAALFLGTILFAGILIASVAVGLLTIIKHFSKKNAIIHDSIFEKVSDRVNNSLYYLMLTLLLFAVLKILVDVVSQ